MPPESEPMAKLLKEWDNIFSDVAGLILSGYGVKVTHQDDGTFKVERDPDIPPGDIHVHYYGTVAKLEYKKEKTMGVPEDVWHKRFGKKNREASQLLLAASQALAGTRRILEVQREMFEALSRIAEKQGDNATAVQVEKARKKINQHIADFEATVQAELDEIQSRQ